MKQNKKWWVIGVLALIAAAAVYVMQEYHPAAKTTENVDPPSRSISSPSPGRVTMIDLGANECIPCKMMAPIIDELKKEYSGKADIIFIDVWKDSAQAKKYGIRAIPTQIFFDKNGQEVFRNIGFMEKKHIVEILSKLGVS